MREIDILAVMDSSLRYVKPAVVLRPHEENAVLRALGQLEALNLPEELYKQALGVLRKAAEKEDLPIDEKDCAALLTAEAASDEPVLLEVNEKNYPILYTVMDLVEERFAADLQEVAAYAWALKGREDANEAAETDDEGPKSLSEQTETASDPAVESESTADVRPGAGFEEMLAQLRQDVFAYLEKMEAEISALKEAAADASTSERDRLIRDLTSHLVETGGMQEESALEQLSQLSDEALGSIAKAVFSKLREADETAAETASDSRDEGFEAPPISELSIEDLKVEDPRIPNPVEVSGPARMSSVEEAVDMVSSAITEEDDETFYAIWRIKR